MKLHTIYIAKYIYIWGNVLMFPEFPRIFPCRIRRGVADKVRNEFSVVVDVAHGSSLSRREIRTLIVAWQGRQLITFTNHHHRLKTEHHVSCNMTTISFVEVDLLPMKHPYTSGTSLPSPYSPSLGISRCTSRTWNSR